MVEKGHDQLSTWGILGDHSIRDVRDWTEQLVGHGYLDKTGEYHILEVTDKGALVLKGLETPRLLKPAEKAPKQRTFKGTEKSWEGVDKGLFDALRALRTEVAKERGVPPYLVFDDAALRDMARCMPGTEVEFLGVHGVGEKKCQDFGARFLESIREYCEEHGLERPEGHDELSLEVEPVAVKARKAKPSSSAAQERAYGLFAEGKGVDEVAEQIGRARSTTWGYLEHYIRDNDISDPDPWVDGSKLERIREAAAHFGAQKMKPIFEFLNGEVTYDDIRITMVCLRNSESAQ